MQNRSRPETHPGKSSITMRALLLLGCCMSGMPHAAGLMADGFESPKRLVFTNADGQALEGWWWRSPMPLASAAPAVVMLHGCSGVYGSNGYGDAAAISTRFTNWAIRLNAHGLHALLVDSFSTRDPQHPPAQARQNYCSDRPAVVAIGAREEVERARDALAGYAALLAQRNPDSTPSVDPSRVGLLGWSHGGSAVLATVASSTLPPPPFTTAQSFYPGCGMYGAFGNPGNGTSSYVAAIPTAIHLGLDDAISTLAACGGHRDHSDQAGGAAFALHTFEQVGHSFDGARCIEQVAGPLLSPWTTRRYACSGSYNGEAFDLRDWQAKLESDRLATCAFLTSFNEEATECDIAPIFP